MLASVISKPKRQIIMLARATLLIVLFSFAPWQSACAKPARAPLEVSTIAQEPADLTDHFMVLEDRQRTVKLEQLLTPEGAQQLKPAIAVGGALNYGVTRSAYWLRFALSNQSDAPVTRMLEIHYARIGEVDFYQTDSDGHYYSQKAGLEFPFSSRAYPNRYVVFPITVAPHSTQIYFLKTQYRSAGSIVIPARLWEPNAYHYYERNDYFNQAWYFGIGSALLLFNLLVYLILRERSYLLYVLYAGSTILAMFSEGGLGAEFLWQEATAWSEISTMVLFALLLGTSYLFIRELLGIRKFSKTLDRILVFICAALFLCPIAFVIDFGDALTPATLLFIVSCLYALMLGIYAAYKRQRFAYIFLLAFGTLIAGGITYALLVLGAVPTNFVTLHGMQIGSAIEMILLALALADRFNEIRKASARDQDALLAAQKQLVESLQSSEKVLEQRVERRTVALEAARAEALNSLATIQVILDTAPVGLILLDTNGRHTQVNKKYQQLVGYSAESLLGTTHERFFANSADYRAFLQRVVATIAHGSLFDEEVQIKRSDGQLRWVHCLVDTIAVGEPNKGLVVAMEDVSDRIQNEQTIKEANLKLEQLLRDLQTSQAYIIQSEKMASLGQLVANVAHEINTPIGAVKSSGASIADAMGQVLTSLPDVLELLNAQQRTIFTQLIAQASNAAAALDSREERELVRVAKTTLEQAGIAKARYFAGLMVQMGLHREIDIYLPLLAHPEAEVIFETATGIVSIMHSTNNINTAVERVSKIIFALKSYSRSPEEEQRIESSVRDSIETVLTIYSNQFRHGVEIVRNYEDVPTIQCYPDALNQVWTNLIYNALQAMNNSGTLTIGIRRVADNVEVSVRDTGSGIPEDIRSRIFEAFFTTKPIGEGSGLGLDIVKKIVEKHNGTISLESEVNVGTTFFVRLPIS